MENANATPMMPMTVRRLTTMSRAMPREFWILDFGFWIDAPWPVIENLKSKIQNLRVPFGGRSAGGDIDDGFEPLGLLPADGQDDMERFRQLSRLRARPAVPAGEPLAAVEVGELELGDIAPAQLAFAGRIVAVCGLLVMAQQLEPGIHPVAPLDEAGPPRQRADEEPLILRAAPLHTRVFARLGSDERVAGAGDTRGELPPEEVEEQPRLLVALGPQGPGPPSPRDAAEDHGGGGADDHENRHRDEQLDERQAPRRAVGGGGWGV